MSNVCKITFSDNIPTSRFDIAIEWFLISLLAFMPFVFGVVHAWSEEVVIILSIAIVTCFLFKLLLQNDYHVIWTWAYVPLGVFLILVVIQLVPLPTWLVSTISPNTVGLKRELLGDLHNTDEALKYMTISFYPYATKHDLRLILAVASIFVVVLNIYRNPEQIIRLLWAITLIGAAVAAIALAQNFFGNGKIYWFIPSRHFTSYSGPFVNHSHYGQFINLSIGAAFGLLMVKLHNAFSHSRTTLPIVFNYLCSVSAKTLWLLIAIIGLGTASVFISLTRGGMISLLIAMGFTTFIVTSKRHLKSQGWIMVVIALIAFTSVLYLGFNAVYDRLANLRELNEAGAIRLQMLKDTIIAWSKFPLFGTGLGTYSVVYPMFDHSITTSLATHTENEYVQAGQETGLIGLSFLITFAVIIFFHFFQNIRRTNHPIYSTAYGLGFGILAILLHSFSDFGQHLPANAFLSAIFCALLIALTRYGQSRIPIITKAPFHKNKLIRLIVSINVLGICIWAFLGANNSRLAEENRKKVHTIEKRLAKANWQGTEGTYADLISHASSVLAYEPGNVKNLYLLNVYRWRSINQTGSPDISKIFVSKDLMPAVHDIIEQLHRACTLCPTYGPTYILAGQIERFILNNNSGAEKIRKGFLLAPCDPIACFIAGHLDVVEGKYEDCIVKFEKAVQLNPVLFPDVVAIYIDHLSRPHLALSLAGDNIDQLNQLTRILDAAQYNDLAQKSRERIKNLLEEMYSRSDITAPDLALLASIYKEQQNIEAAIECYRSALMLDYSQVHWRIELAKLLAENKRISEAMREAKTCLRLSPHLKEAKELVADFSVHPALWDKDIQSH